LPGNAILQQIDASIERLLAGFRWQSIDFVDALSHAGYAPGMAVCVKGNAGKGRGLSVLQKTRRKTGFFIVSSLVSGGAA